MRFSHRLAPTKDQSQSGSVIRPKQSRAHQPQTDMHVNERTVGRSGGLFVWVIRRKLAAPSFEPTCVCQACEDQRRRSQAPFIWAKKAAPVPELTRADEHQA